MPSSPFVFTSESDNQSGSDSVSRVPRSPLLRNQDFRPSLSSMGLPSHSGHFVLPPDNFSDSRSSMYSNAPLVRSYLCFELSDCTVKSVLFPLPLISISTLLTPLAPLTRRQSMSFKRKTRDSGMKTSTWRQTLKTPKTHSEFSSLWDICALTPFY